MSIMPKLRDLILIRQMFNEHQLCPKYCFRCRSQMLTFQKVGGETSNQKNIQDFPGGPVVKNPPADAEDMGLIADPGASHILWDK